MGLPNGCSISSPAATNLTPIEFQRGRRDKRQAIGQPKIDVRRHRNSGDRIPSEGLDQLEWQ